MERRVKFLLAPGADRGRSIVDPDPARKIPFENLWALAILWPFLLIGAGLSLLLRPYWRYASALMSLLVVGGLFCVVVFAAQFGWNHMPDRIFDGGIFFGGPSARAPAM